MILGFLGATWLAAKIYRTGILMYGKKVSYKELWKWIKVQVNWFKVSGSIPPLKSLSALAEG